MWISCAGQTDTSPTQTPRCAPPSTSARGARPTWWTARAVSSSPRKKENATGQATPKGSWHRIGKSAKLFLSSSELGSPLPRTQASVHQESLCGPSPPIWFLGGGTLPCGRGGGGSQFGRRDRHCGTLATL
jgi:hypothetical protein